LSAQRILPYNKALHGAGRKTFRSNSPALDSYFQVQLSQDLRTRVATCFVATDAQGVIIGFYTLCSSGVSLADLPEETTRKLPRYPLVPVARMGRLAVDHRFQGQGFGGILLADAMARAAHSEVASYAMVVDAKDPIAGAFYEHHGFMALPSNPMIYFFPLANIP